MRKKCRKYLNITMIVILSLVQVVFCSDEKKTERVSDMKRKIITVRGAIEPNSLGRGLCHEHVMVDFIGADKTGPERWNDDEIVEVMEPYLRQVAEQGFTWFVDCTPAYLGRDVEVLQTLSERTGVHILTNTGFYGALREKYLPGFVQDETPGEIAKRWIREFEDGIDGTGIHPGFIKIGVDAKELTEGQVKIVQAAAKTHLATGLVIMCHVGGGNAALEVAHRIRDAGVAGQALIIAHADGIAPMSIHYELAEMGVWLEYDGIGTRRLERHVEMIQDMIGRGYAGQLFFSHDAGWYTVGQKKGGVVRPFTALVEEMLPALEKAGVEEKIIDQILRENPKKAFIVGKKPE